MINYGGFEGNAQTLRILTKLEKKFIQFNDPNYYNIDDNSGFLTNKKDDFYYDKRKGLNLTLLSLASIIKYDNKIGLNLFQRKKDKQETSKAVKGFYETEEDIVKKIKKHLSVDKLSTIEKKIMDIADDIAYSTCDLEDSFKAGFITPLNLLSSDFEVWKRVAEKISMSEFRSIEPKDLDDYMSGFCDDIDRIESYKKIIREIYPSHTAPQISSEFDKIKNFILEYFSPEFKSTKSRHSELHNLIGSFISVFKVFIIMNETKKIVEPILNIPIDSEGLGAVIDVNRKSSQLAECAYERTKFTSELIHHFITAVNIEIKEIKTREGKRESFFNLKLLNNRFNVSLSIAILKRFTYEYQISSSRLKIVEYRGKEIVRTIFKSILKSKGEFLPADLLKIYKKIESNISKIISDNYQNNFKENRLLDTIKTNNRSTELDKLFTRFEDTLKSLNENYLGAKENIFLRDKIRAEELLLEIIDQILNNNKNISKSKDKELFKLYEFECERRRLICDYVANMTDRYAVEFYARLKSENASTIFKSL